MGFFGRKIKTQVAEKEDAGKRTFLFLLPHQDDELLSMGAFASNVLGNERDKAYAVLCTDGSSSGVRRVLADGQTCGKHADKHVYNMDAEHFADARDKEFLGSCQALGFRPSQVVFHPKRAKDGSLSVEHAEKMILSFLHAFDFGKEAVVCTMSPLVGGGQHSDHRNLGRAALNLFERRKIDKLLLFVEPYCVDEFKRNNPKIALSECGARGDSVKNLQRAIESYSLWNPDEGRYAIGYHSVTSDFDDFMRNPVSYFHDART